MSARKPHAELRLFTNPASWLVEIFVAVDWTQNK